jgi:hypothetical protein
LNAQQPKQYLKLENGLSVLDQTLKTLLNIEKIKGCVVAIAENDTDFKNSVFANHDKLLATAMCGKSVLEILIALYLLHLPLLIQYFLFYFSVLSIDCYAPLGQQCPTAQTIS